MGLFDVLRGSAESDDRAGPNRVSEEYSCPKCAERRVDSLVWRRDFVVCMTCGMQYRLEDDPKITFPWGDVGKDT